MTIAIIPRVAKTVLSVAAALLLQALAATPALALGVLYQVNTTADDPNTHDPAPGDGFCETAFGNGVCTLRAAIEETNGHAGTDGIRFSIPTSDPGYNAQTGVYTINLNAVLPSVTDSVNITGPGATVLTVQRNPNVNPDTFPAFRIFNISTGGTVNIAGLTIARGSADNGGGIQNANTGTVNVTNCIFSNNQAGSSSSASRSGGGAIFNNLGTLTVTSSTFQSNLAAPSYPQACGGGIYNKGTASITNSTFTGNRTTLGGGLFNETGAAMTVSGSTFDRNGARDGGAVENFGTFTAVNSTFYANIAYSDVSGIGGGIYNAGTANLSNSTVAYNFAGFIGGGFYNNTGRTANVKSSIIASNFQSTDSPDVYGAFSSKGFNLIGKKSGSTGFSAATDKKGTLASPLDPKFDTRGLRNNGGLTETLGLLTGSPAIDKGTSASLTGSLATDQRGSGFPRIADNTSVANAAGGDGADIGAFEAPAP